MTRPRARRLAPAMALLLWGAPLAGQEPGQVAVTARLEPSRVSLGEAVELVIEVDPPGIRTRVEEPELPDIAALVLGQSRESQVRADGVDLSRRVVYRYRLRPLAAGSFRIDPIRIVIDGRPLYTSPLEAVVRADEADRPAGPLGLGAERARTASDPPPFFVITRLDRDRARVGEQVTLTFAFYHDPGVPLAESPDYDPPPTPGFWRLELDREPRVSAERIGRRSYHVQRFRYALFPLRAGVLTIEPAGVRLVEPDPERWWRAGEARTLRTDRLRVVAEALPPDAPPAFDGAVGRYALEGGMRQARATAGIPVELELTVSGVGNPTAVGTPLLPAWPDVLVQPPVVLTETDVRDGTVGGRTTFRYLLSPQSAGRLDLGHARFAYFDPAAGRYAVDTIALGEIEVLPVSGTAGPAVARHRPMAGPTLWPPREPSRPGPVGLAAEAWYWGALAGPWAAWLAVAGAIGARRRRVAGHSREAPLARFAHARRTLAAGKPEGVTVALGAMDEALAARFGRDVPVGIAREAAEIREALLAAAYSQRPHARVDQALARLEKTLRAAPGARSSGRRRGWPFALIALAPAAAAWAQSAGESPDPAIRLWESANQAYRAGDFQRAAGGYRDLLHDYADPRIEADLAATLWRTNARGEAVAHYRHALALAPRSAAIRQDLERLRAELGLPPAAVSTRYGFMDRVRLDEILLVLLAANGLAFLLTALAMRTRRVRGPAAAALALVALTAAAAGLHAHTIGRVDLAVIVRPAPVTSAPSGPVLTTLGEGTIVEVLERAPTGWRIRPYRAPAGWVASAVVVPLDFPPNHSVNR